MANEEGIGKSELVGLLYNLAYTGGYKESSDRLDKLQAGINTSLSQSLMYRNLGILAEAGYNIDDLLQDNRPPYQVDFHCPPGSLDQETALAIVKSANPGYRGKVRVNPEYCGFPGMFIPVSLVLTTTSIIAAYKEDQQSAEDWIKAINSDFDDNDPFSP